MHVRPHHEVRVAVWLPFWLPHTRPPAPVLRCVTDPAEDAVAVIEAMAGVSIDTAQAKLEAALATDEVDFAKFGPKQGGAGPAIVPAADTNRSNNSNTSDSSGGDAGAAAANGATWDEETIKAHKRSLAGAWNDVG